MVSSEILDDRRAIDSIYVVVTEPGGEVVFTVGYAGTERIEVYAEPGTHSEKPWFRIIKDGEVAVRVPAALFAIQYR